MLLTCGPVNTLASYGAIATTFADEPSGNLDTRNASELHDLFFKLRDELNQTFVIVTHNQYLAKQADRMLQMQDGLMV